MPPARTLGTWIDAVVLDLGRQMRWTFLPPLMVYFAAGFSGLTMIAGTFFVKEYLDLSAAYLAGLAFWAGLPWALKMPLGHLVDIIWKWKWLLIWIGAALMALSVLIMYLVLSRPAMMAAVMPVSARLCHLLLPAGALCAGAAGRGGRYHVGRGSAAERLRTSALIIATLCVGEALSYSSILGGTRRR